jgi:CubicO group peptidase (beta-lactamase class C family)
MNWNATGLSSYLVSFLVLLATVALPGCQQHDSNVSGPRELPAVTAEEAGFSSERLNRLTAEIEETLQAEDTPGVVALILRDGQIVYEKAFGHRTPARETAMTTDTIFRIYSMTKPITSVAVMMLWVEGAFDLQDPVGDYLPEFNDARVAIEDASTASIVDTETPRRPITIQDLMRHTSGLTYGIFGPMTGVKRQYLEAGLALDTFDGDLQQYVEAIAAIPLAAHPGDRWEYSPSPTVLGRLVEVISGQSFAAFLKERLCELLGMVDTAFFVPASKHDRIAEGIGRDLRGHFRELHDVTGPPKLQAGDAGLVSTARDYARFAHMMLNGGEFMGVRILNPKTVDFMTSDHLGPDVDKGPLYFPGPGYGFGLGFSVRLDQGIAPFPGSPGDFGWGGLAGTISRIDPQERLVIILMVQDIPNFYLYRRKLRTLTCAAIVRKYENRD